MATSPDANVASDPASDIASAVVIQKLYRGYRARRKLADAAVMAKSFGWWNLLDSVVLQEHTQQYYAHSDSWKARVNWKRLNQKAAKVGKGLSKDNKALKLALQHWLEAVDARHRYGRNSHPYYSHWLELNTHEPSFYWLDVGDGRRVELPKCSRARLSQEMIDYLRAEKTLEVEVHDGKLVYKQTGELLDTGVSDDIDDRWIFVMSPYGKLYVGKKERGGFQHSSFLAGGATIAAGRLSVRNGTLQLMEAHSGHYCPRPENFQSLIRVLIEKGADLSSAKVLLVSETFLKANEGKKLAGAVRTTIEEVNKEECVAVKVENQSLVSVDSGVELVTGLVFPSAAEKPKVSKEPIVPASFGLVETPGFPEIPAWQLCILTIVSKPCKKYVLEALKLR